MSTTKLTEKDKNEKSQKSNDFFIQIFSKVQINLSFQFKIQLNAQGFVTAKPVELVFSEIES